MPLLSAHQLSVSKRDRLLFDEINISVSAGDLMYIKGPNGAGKTSLLRVLTGLVNADSGSVAYRGQNIMQNRETYQSDLLYFGHALGINRSLNPLENLMYWCCQHNVMTTKNAIYDILSVLGLVGLEDVPVSNLSAGQQRRVALARFWLKTAATVWILDEPFTALDVQGIALLNTRIIEHLQQGGCVVMTSHQALDVDYPTKELQLEYRI
ncbi:cytochrome c biogenesis heme-transporting ATPase CcmA [Paraglaciecola mesophila]|uniref:Heme exporter protein A n=2 Tax=Paraglaciecola mesophila TaxID=197222 RepID=K6XWQ9_9ALTE|nr:cytochrome c biogenesis heme-transporting ATPase CcmA [Paraglaciecola mesophila]GAC25064.1 heme exporter protein A [Paraglaciecola mesophila KMM 241]